jgi:hypothetical protein
VLLQRCQAVPRDPGFGNGRFARRMLDAMITRQAGRISQLAVPTTEGLRLLVPDDVPDPG